jgi:hypothetical protein
LGAPIALFTCSTLSVAVGPVSPYSLREPTLSPYFSHQFSSHTLLTFALWNPTSIRDEEEKKKKQKHCTNPMQKLDGNFLGLGILEVCLKMLDRRIIPLNHHK